jgi:hypothetical protein
MSPRPSSPLAGQHKRDFSSAGRSSKFDVQLFQLVGLDLGSGDPFLHQWHCHDGAAVMRRHRIERDVVGEKLGGITGRP